MNQLILGDCLEVMQKMDSESVDSEGLEAIEVIKLKVNGAVERE
jgi:hypothetical protein